MIYLDNAASTPMFEKGVEIYEKYACHSFFNPSAGYGESLKIKKELDNVRKLILKKLGATKGDIIFTSGATESNNLAILGSKRNGAYEYVFSEGEHPSVYNVAKFLQQAGFAVRFVKLQKNGQIDYDELQKSINDRTRLISVIQVSNETGAINDVKRISQIRDKFAKNALLHVDGVQAFCKIKFCLDNLNVDFYTISAHKFHGPKGVGALYVKHIEGLKSILFGGGQENGYRSGTENVGGIMSMGYAIENIDVEKNSQIVSELKNKVVEILSQNNHIKINDLKGSPYIISCSFDDVNGETLMRALADKGVLVGIGSACSTGKAGNRVLESMGFEKENIKSHIRISLSEMLTLEEIEEACTKILETYNEIREKVL